MSNDEKLHNLLHRGVEEIIDKERFEALLKKGQPLRVKLGIDPTSPNVHLGRTVPLLKLRDFQELGHQIVFIVGDSTGVIGDTSDKDSERPMLDDEVIDENKQTYFEQVKKILDPDKTEFLYNSQWLNKLTYNEIGEHASVFSLHDFVMRDNINRRLKAGKRVSLREVLYPLMQGYDSVAVKADVEIGGTDQRFNLLAGRSLQEHFGQDPQVVMTLPLVAGLDGRKMSSSWGNGIYIKDTPQDIYGKTMSMRDELILTYFVNFTRVPMSVIKQYQQQLNDGVNPKDIKMILAKTLVAMYHSEAAADEAQNNWKIAFEKGLIPANTKTVKTQIKIPLAEILIKQGLVKSKAEFRRLVEAGAITFKGKIEEKKIMDPHSLAEESGALKIGKKRFLKILVEKKADPNASQDDTEEKIQ